MAEVWVTSTTPTSITCEYGYVGDISPTRRTMKWYLNGVLKTSYTIPGDQESDEYTFNYLSPGTTYSIMVNMATPNGWNKDYTTEGTTSYYDTDSATVSYTASTNSITIKVSGITPRSYVREVRCVKGNTRYTDELSAYSTSAEFEFKDLSPGTAYYFEVGIRNPDGERTFYEKVNGDGYVSTLAYTYTLLPITSSATSSTLTIYVSISEKQSMLVPFTFTLEYGGTKRSFDLSMPIGSTSMEARFSSVPPATYCAYYVYDQLRDKSFGPQYRRTKNNFAWASTVDPGEPFKIKAGSKDDDSWEGSWNDYTSQLKEKVEHYGGSYNPATVNPGDELTSTRMNNIAAVINWLVDNNKGDCKTKLDHVDPGDSVTAKRIKLLAQCLNE